MLITAENIDQRRYSEAEATFGKRIERELEVQDSIRLLKSLDSPDFVPEAYDADKLDKSLERATQGRWNEVFSLKDGEKVAVAMWPGGVWKTKYLNDEILGQSRTDALIAKYHELIGQESDLDVLYSDYRMVVVRLNGNENTETWQAKMNVIGARIDNEMCEYAKEVLSTVEEPGEKTAAFLESLNSQDSQGFKIAVGINTVKGAQGNNLLPIYQSVSEAFQMAQSQRMGLFKGRIGKGYCQIYSASHRETVINALRGIRNDFFQQIPSGMAMKFTFIKEEGSNRLYSLVKRLATGDLEINAELLKRIRNGSFKPADGADAQLDGKRQTYDEIVKKFIAYGDTLNVFFDLFCPWTVDEMKGEVDVNAGYQEGDGRIKLAQKVEREIAAVESLKRYMEGGDSRPVPREVLEQLPVLMDLLRKDPKDSRFTSRSEFFAKAMESGALATVDKRGAGTVQLAKYDQSMRRLEKGEISDEEILRAPDEATLSFRKMREELGEIFPDGIRVIGDEADAFSTAIPDDNLIFDFVKNNNCRMVYLTNSAAASSPIELARRFFYLEQGNGAIKIMEKTFDGIRERFRNNYDDDQFIRFVSDALGHNPMETVMEVRVLPNQKPQFIIRYRKLVGEDTLIEEMNFDDYLGFIREETERLNSERGSLLPK
jgi:hypothetical protein